MTNPYYNETFTAALGSQARSRALDNEFQRIQAAFDALDSSITALTIAAGRRFTLLEDCPSTLTGSGLKLVRVNAAASALEFVAGGIIPLVNVASSRDIAATDFGRLLICNSATDMTLTLQPNSSVPIDAESSLVVTQWGAGKVTLVAGSGVTLRSAGGLLSTRAQFSQITVIKTAADEALVGGDLAA